MGFLNFSAFNDAVHTRIGAWVRRDNSGVPSGRFQFQRRLVMLWAWADNGFQTAGRADEFTHFRHIEDS